MKEKLEWASPEYETRVWTYEPEFKVYPDERVVSMEKMQPRLVIEEQKVVFTQYGEKDLFFSKYEVRENSKWNNYKDTIIYKGIGKMIRPFGRLLPFCKSIYSEAAFIVTEMDNTHTLIVARVLKHFDEYVLRYGIIAKDIEDYTMIGDKVALLKMKDYYLFFNVMSWAPRNWGIKSTYYTDYKLPFKKLKLKDFHINFKWDCRYFLCKADGQNCLLERTGNQDVFSGYEIIPLGKVKILAGNDKESGNGCFISTDEEGKQTIYECKLKSFYGSDGKETIIYKTETYDSIEKFKEDEYPTGFSNEEGYYGYWFKKNGKIVKMVIYPSKPKREYYTIFFMKPVNKVRFIKRKMSVGGTKMDIWKADGKIVLKEVISEEDKKVKSIDNIHVILDY